MKSRILFTECCTGSTPLWLIRLQIIGTVVLLHLEVVELGVFFFYIPSE